MVNIKETWKKTKKFSPNIDNLQMHVRIDLDCSHPHNAYHFLKELLKKETVFEISFDSDKNSCCVIIVPDNIETLNNKRLADLFE